MAKSYGYDEDDYNNQGGQTLPDYQNFRNVLFIQWEELNNLVVEYRTSTPSKKKAFYESVVRAYLRFFSQINDNKKLGLLKPNERKFLIRCYNYPSLITPQVSKILLDITRKLMTEYGVFDLEGGDNGEIW